MTNTNQLLKCTRVGIRLTVFTLFMLALTLPGIPLFAQAADADENDDPAAAGDLEEVVVLGNFIAADGRSGLKTDVPLRDVPMTISSYTDAFMESIETTRISDLYNYMVGVQRAGNTGYDISIRGFSSGGADRNSMQTDGLPGLAVRFGSPPTINTARIEVVKGPMSVLYGRVQPGGFINIITKKPQAQKSNTFKIRADSYYGADTEFSDTLGFTASFDSTGPLNESGSVLYRLVAEVEDRDGFRDNSFSESTYIVPSVTWLVSEKTTTTLSLEYRDEEHALDNFLVAPNRDYELIADITTSYQEPGDIQPEEGYTIALNVNHEINENLLWRTNFRYVDHEDSAIGWENLSFRNDTTLRRRDRDQFNIREYTFIDTNLTWDIASSGGMEHKIMIGLNGGEETSNFERRNFDGGNATLDIDIYRPIYGQGVARTPVPSSHRFTTFESYGVYLQDQITFNDNWKAVLGIRYEDFDAVEEDKRGVNPNLETSGDGTVPMIGVIYQPNDRWSFYASYAESFNPPRPDRRDADDQRNFPPEEGEQIEAGFKADILDGNGSLTLSVFSIEKRNVLNSLGGGRWEITGAEESEGVEVEVNANINDNWQIIAGFTYADAKVIEDRRAANVGQQLRNAPEFSASIWSRYDVNENFGIGFGINHVDDRFGEVPRSGDRVFLPSYTVSDLVFYYTQPSFSATLKFGNLFDEIYYESGTNDRKIVPGAPASIILSFSKNF